MKARAHPAIAGQPIRADYERDFFAWTRQTAVLLRQARFEAIDIERLAEEVVDMGKRDLRELDSRVQVVLVHLLKWQAQSTKRSRSWRTTLLTQRLEIARLLNDSPSLRSAVTRRMSSNFAGARRLAATETGLSDASFPLSCPFSAAQILDTDYHPD